MRTKIVFLVFFLLLAFQAAAEDFPGETTNLEDEFNKGFSADKGMKESDQKEVDADRLKIGGSLKAEWYSYLTENPQDDFLLSPMTLDLYLDSQLKNDVRAFFKGRLIHDASVDETVPNPLTGSLDKQSAAVLDEMKTSWIQL